MQQDVPSSHLLTNWVLGRKYVGTQGVGIVRLPRGGGVGGFSTSTGFMPKRAIISADIVAMAATKL
jgi:hypothetical protein